jgi:hypothetical protein
VIDRRVFAVPVPADRPGGVSESLDSGRIRRGSELDAASPADRALITVHDASSRGVPAWLFDSYVAVAEQLWADNPPEVWAAAQRMQAADQPRHAILDRLARTFETAGGPDADPAAYAASLTRLSAADRSRKG